MRLTKHTSYGIKMLIECERSGERLVKVATIAERNGLTLQHALKIAHALMRAGFLVNQRGRNGGIRLARPAGEISIGEVVRAMETTNLDAETDASIAGVLDDAFGAFIGVLDQHTIADFAVQPRAGGAAGSAGGVKRPAAKAAAARVRAPVRRRNSEAAGKASPR